MTYFLEKIRVFFSRTASAVLFDEILTNLTTMTAKDQQVKISVTKDQQLNDLKNSVVQSVGKTVKTEMKSYSEALGTNENLGSVDCNMIKKVFQEVVAEEDRSKNLIIFGLEEKKNESLPDIVSEVLLELGEKPTFGAS